MSAVPPSMAMGQAAGVAAALAVQGKKPVHGIAVPALQEQLRAQGAYLDLENAGRIL